MNILFLSTWFPYPPDNGSKIRAYYLLRALARQHKITLISFDRHSNAPAENIAHLASLGIDVYAVPVDPHQFVPRVPRLLVFLSPIPVAFWPSKIMRKAVRHIAGQSKWDVTVALQASAGRYAATIPSTMRVLDVDTDLSYQMYEHYSQQSSFAGKLRGWVSWLKAYRYGKHLYHKFEICVTAMPLELDYLRGMANGPERRIEVISNGVDCDLNRPGVTEVQPNTLIYNGALTYSANYDAMHYFLAEIYPRIRQQLPGVSLSITGSTKGVELSALPLDESVHLTGYVEDIRLPVAASAVCVVPLRQGGGTRLKILEAMALGTPVVSTSKGAEGLEVVDGEHLLLADDPAAFAAATLRLLREPALRARLAANARRLVEARYDWSHIGASFVALVENACHKAP